MTPGTTHKTSTLSLTQTTGFLTTSALVGELITVVAGWTRSRLRSIAGDLTLRLRRGISEQSFRLFGACRKVSSHGGPQMRHINAIINAWSPKLSQ